MSGEHSGDLRKLETVTPVKLSGGLKFFFIAGVLIGTVAFVSALRTDSERAWASFVVNHFFFLLLGVGGLFFAALQWMTNAAWSAPVRRIAEAFTSYLPFVLLGCVGIFLGIHEIYHWSHPEAVQGDAVLQGKSGFLSVPFFIIRNSAAVLIWIFFAVFMVRNSLKQDETKEISLFLKNRSATPVFMILFALTLTLVSFDQIMSLNPHWFSTIFGVYCFAGLFCSTLAAMCIITIFLKRSGSLEGIVNDNHLHDIGKFMFAFSVFWAYIGFSQFMLIWYANLPEETIYYRMRSEGTWHAVMGILFFLKFIVPFFVLMPRGTKRNESVLLFSAFLMLAAQWLDCIWMVQPEFFSSGPKIGFVEIGMFLGFLGLFGLSVGRFLGRHRVVAIGDPHLKRAITEHHQ